MLGTGEDGYCTLTAHAHSRTVQTGYIEKSASRYSTKHRVRDKLASRVVLSKTKYIGRSVGRRSRYKFALNVLGSSSCGVEFAVSS